MFGARAYRHKKRVTLMIELEDWNNEKIYNRIGLSDETTRLFNTDITKITIPVRPGRSIASLIEVAAMNHRLKVMGYNAAEAFTNQLNQLYYKPRVIVNSGEGHWSLTFQLIKNGGDRCGSFND